MIGLVTDSNSQLPPSLVARYGVEVVPVVVIIDGVEYLEEVDIDADRFYQLFEHGTPSVATSQPSPGAFIEAYERLAAAGADEILSIHLGADVSGTLNSARLAAESVGVPVRLVDTGTASFGVACCVWEAGEAIANGASIEEAALVAERLAPSIGNVFVVKALDLARAGGRVHVEEDADTADAIPVLSLVEGEVRVIARAIDVDAAATVMVDYAASWGDSLKVAIGVADAGAQPLADTLDLAFHEHPSVRELIHYRIGPSIGAHTGPGTAGAFFYSAR